MSRGSCGHGRSNDLSGPHGRGPDLGRGTLQLLLQVSWAASTQNSGRLSGCDSQPARVPPCSHSRVLDPSCTWTCPKPDTSETLDSAPEEGSWGRGQPGGRKELRLDSLPNPDIEKHWIAHQRRACWGGPAWGKEGAGPGLCLLAQGGRSRAEAHEVHSSSAAGRGDGLGREGLGSTSTSGSNTLARVPRSPQGDTTGLTGGPWGPGGPGVSEEQEQADTKAGQVSPSLWKKRHPAHQRDPLPGSCLILELSSAKHTWAPGRLPGLHLGGRGEGQGHKCTVGRSRAQATKPLRVQPALGTHPARLSA